MYEWPEAFLARMAGQLGDELPDFLRALEEPWRRGIRFNPLKPKKFHHSFQQICVQVSAEEYDYYQPV